MPLSHQSRRVLAAVVAVTLSVTALGQASMADVVPDAGLEVPPETAPEPPAPPVLDELALGAPEEEAAALAAQFDERPDRAYVARGDEFVDALAISSLAGGLRQPILLTQPTTLPRVIPPAIAALEPGTITAVGGETAISRGVLELLGDPGTYLPGD